LSVVSDQHERSTILPPLSSLVHRKFWVGPVDEVEVTILIDGEGDA
jgi:hypothetical protein